MTGEVMYFLTFSEVFFTDFVTLKFQSNICHRFQGSSIRLFIYGARGFLIIIKNIKSHACFE
jgi:hypothetical protein